MIQIKKIRPQRVRLFNPNNEFIGWVNYWELNDVLIQLHDNYVDGYYCLYKGNKLPILKQGKILRPPKGFFDLIDEQMKKLMGF